MNAIVQRYGVRMEDARVEHEMRIPDEGIVGRGYEALLMLPGALSSTISAPHDEASSDNARVGSLVDVEAQIMAFIDETHPSFREL